MNFYHFKDNVKHKYQENDKLEELKEYIESHCAYQEELLIKKPGLERVSIKVKKELVLKIIKKLIEENETMIETYLKICFEKSKKEGEDNGEIK